MFGDIKEETLLLEYFNQRDSVAFGYFYQKLYDQLYYYSAKLYADTEVLPEDAIHDIFIYLWKSKKIKFDNLYKLKAYLIISIKNRYWNYLEKQKSKNRYIQFCKESNQQFETDVAQMEIISLISNSISLLPKECAKVFRLHIQGWQVKEIANKLGKAESTVYAQKQKALKILKQKIKEIDINFLTIFLLG
ncbi:MAG: sigma-70 family RNA polymerase sigma factor [Bacteroidales bacterium]|nr:sigma-70 family RNA polymerase sigma factor [Bacteroidales bacterium]